MLEVPVIDLCFVFKLYEALFLVRVEDVFKVLEHWSEIRMILIRCIRRRKESALE